MITILLFSFPSNFCLLIQKCDLNNIHLLLPIPMVIKLTSCPINLTVRDLEGNSVIGISSEQEVLVAIVGGLQFLLKGTHDPMFGDEIRHDFGVVNLNEETLLLGVRVQLLNHPISRLPDPVDLLVADLCSPLGNNNIVPVLPGHPSR